MKPEDMENKLLDYLLGDLDWKERSSVEETIRTQAETKAIWERLQLGLEREMTHEAPSATPRKSLRAEILETLPNRDHPHQKQGWPSAHAIRWFHWSGWGIAACLLVSIALLRPGDQRPVSLPDHELQPVLAIYDLQGTTGENQHSPTRLREIIYQKRPSKEALLRAEHIAEQLWNDPSSGNAVQRSTTSSVGFVVIDLQGKQGFIGLYQNANPQLRQEGEQQLWLAESSGKNVSSIGILPSGKESNEGVYYFSFQNEGTQPLAPDGIMPVINSKIPKGI